MATNELYRLRYIHVSERFTSFESISWNASQRSTDWDVLQRIAVLEGSCSDKTNRGRNIDSCQWTATLESRIGNHCQRLTECDFLQALAAWKGMATNELYGLRHGHAFQRLTVYKGPGPNYCQGLGQSDACQVLAPSECLFVDSSHRLWDCHRKQIFADLEGEIFNFRDMGRNGNMKKVFGAMDVCSCCRFNLCSGVNNHHLTSSMKAKTNKSSNPYRRVIHPSLWHSCMVPRQKSCISQISFVIHIKIDQYHSLRSVPRATSQSHESKSKQIIQPLSKSYPSIYMM